MIVDYILYKKGIVCYHFDTNNKEVTYLQSISDKKITFIQKNTGDREFNVIELDHYKGYSFLTDYVWGMVKDTKNSIIQFYILPKSIARKLDKGIIAIENCIDYDVLINSYTDNGYIHYKTASLIYFTKLNKKDLKLSDVTTNDVSIRTLNTR